MTTEDLVALLRALADAHGRSVSRIARERMAEFDPSVGLDSVDFSTVSDTERFGSSLAILRPFLAQVWDAGYNVGNADMEDYLSNPGAHVDTPNPFKDPS